MRMTAWPSWATFTRQSTRCSEPAAISTVCAVSLHRLEDAAVELQHDLDGLLRLELVVDVGRQHDLVLLDEEPGRLEPDEQVLGRDDLRLGLADLGAQAHRPALDLPGRQALGQGELDLGGAVGAGGERRRPRRRCRRSWCGRRAGPACRRLRRRRTRPRRLTPIAAPGPAAPALAPAAIGAAAMAVSMRAIHPPAIPAMPLRCPSSAPTRVRRPGAVPRCAASHPKAPRSCMPTSSGFDEVVKPAVEARLGLRVDATASTSRTIP